MGVVVSIAPAAAPALAAGVVVALLEQAEATRSTAVAVPRSRRAIPRGAAWDRVIVPPPWTDGRWHGSGLSSPIRPTTLPPRRVPGARTGRLPWRLPDETARRGYRCRNPAAAGTARGAPAQGLDEWREPPPGGFQGRRRTVSTAQGTRWICPRHARRTAPQRARSRRARPSRRSVATRRGRFRADSRERWPGPRRCVL